MHASLTLWNTACNIYAQRDWDDYEKEQAEEEGGMNFNSKKYERREKKVIEKG